LIVSSSVDWPLICERVDENGADGGTGDTSRKSLAAEFKLRCGAAAKRTLPLLYARCKSITLPLSVMGGRDAE
jgi:hypothetical protein